MEKFNPIQDHIARKRDMWDQHTEFNRLGYDGHNRRSGITTTGRLKRRRNRRRMNRWMNESVVRENRPVSRIHFDPVGFQGLKTGEPLFYLEPGVAHNVLPARIEQLPEPLKNVA